MAKGKCWIYKRAALHIQGAPIQIVDYSDGTEEFDCDTVNIQGRYPIYIWQLPGGSVSIPMNIPRTEVDGIVRTGSRPYAGGVLRWEYIFGKYKSYKDYYLSELKRCLPFIIVIILLLIRNQS